MTIKNLLGALLLTAALVLFVVGLGANVDISASTSTFSELGGFPPYALPALPLKDDSLPYTTLPCPSKSIEAVRL